MNCGISFQKKLPIMLGQNLRRLVRNEGIATSVGRGFDSHRGQKIFSLPRVVPCFPLLGLTPVGYSWV